MELSDHLREMLKELGQAINESISGSGRVHDSIQQIRDEGYNLYMVLDAKVGVNRREARDAIAAAPADGDAPSRREPRPSERAAFRINLKDLRFLKSARHRSHAQGAHAPRRDRRVGATRVAARRARQ